MAEESSTEVFVYTEGSVVPMDVVRVRVHPSVTVIPEEAFQARKKLEEVELNEGLLEIGLEAFSECKTLKKIKIPSTVIVIEESAFAECDMLEEVELSEGLLEIKEDVFFDCASLIQVNIPTSITRIGRFAFGWVGLNDTNLPNSIESIDRYAFCGTKFPIFRMPPLITIVSAGSMGRCQHLFSINIPESVQQIEQHAFGGCYSLRNIAFPNNVNLHQLAFEWSGLVTGCKDLKQIFNTDQQLIHGLKHRFDNLPIHKMIYYQSYNNVTVDQLNNATNMRSGQRRSLRSKLNPSGSQQDCLGMTPLHIMACSTVQSIDLYKVLIEKYPETLITEDRWGAVPLLYAVWGDAPKEIVKFLGESCSSLYPNHRFDWSKMILVLAQATTKNTGSHPSATLHALQEAMFPGQDIDFDLVLEKAVLAASDNHAGYIPRESFRCLVALSFSKRLKAIQLRTWRKGKLEREVYRNIENGTEGRREYITVVETAFVNLETEYHKLKEATSTLELAMWKKKMNDHCQEKNEKRRVKKMKIEEAELRKQCRVASGAGVVIGHILSFLIG